MISPIAVLDRWMYYCHVSPSGVNGRSESVAIFGDDLAPGSAVADTVVLLYEVWNCHYVKAQVWPRFPGRVVAVWCGGRGWAVRGVAG